MGINEQTYTGCIKGIRHIKFETFTDQIIDSQAFGYKLFSYNKSLLFRRDSTTAKSLVKFYIFTNAVGSTQVVLLNLI